uniref:AIG1-type G domain-containing protein n=1 Tax=Echeneis naucrates TaxID=173247 RepID=A0A665WSG0_ECHNA
MNLTLSTLEYSERSCIILLTIVLLGKTGVGKSSLANSILGTNVFSFSDFEKSICQAKSGSVNGRHVTLVDTPGLISRDRSGEELKSEILGCISECAPGPHAFLIVLKVEKMTEQEKAVITQICQYFSEDILKYATVVFTHGDQLTEGMKIEEFVDQSDDLRELIKKCSGRCCVVDNKYWKNRQQDEYRTNQYQVAKLLDAIDEMIVKNKGGCYTTKMLTEWQAQQDERIKPSSASVFSIFKHLMNSLKRKPWAFVGAALGVLIAILGKTGAGKSSLVNTICGEEVFKVYHNVNSGTKDCQSATRSVHNRRITLIDTPGLFDTDRAEEELKAEILRCITECAPGPHAFLILLKVEKFTVHENAVVEKLLEYFSEEAFKYAAVVFTHGDQLSEGETIKDFVQKNEKLKEIVGKCGHRCHVIDNKYWKNNNPQDYRSNQFQVQQLLQTIDDIFLANRGTCYTNEMLQEPRRIVILGKTGAGKSSLANTIFGDEVFDISHAADSGTTNCQSETRSVYNRRITLVDTPGFFDTDRAEEELKAEILRCITECAPGPHAFLILLKVEKFTVHENAVVEKILEYFSEEAFKYAAVVFTHGDQLLQGETIQDFVQKNEKLNEVVGKCGHRCHVIDNKYWKNDSQEEYRSNKFQVQQLLQTINDIFLANGGTCYTNEMLQAVYKKVVEEETHELLLCLRMGILFKVNYLYCQ